MAGGEGGAQGAGFERSVQGSSSTCLALHFRHAELLAIAIDEASDKVYGPHAQTLPFTDAFTRLARPIRPPSRPWETMV